MENDYVINILKINECKICLEHVDEYIKYCNCSGTIKYLHKNCLIEYILKNKNKIENDNCYRYKIECDLCKLNIYFYYKKSNLFYILTLLYWLLFIIFTVLYFVFLIKYLPKLQYILIYILASSFYYSSFYLYLKPIGYPKTS